jgi:uncharacterized protein YjiS (DUF1127 family)
VRALNHSTAIASDINHASTSTLFDITAASAHRWDGARVGTSRRRESFAWRTYGRLASAAIAGIRVMRAIPSNRGVSDLSSHQLRDIGLEHSHFATPTSRSLELLMMFADHTVPRTHVAPRDHATLTARTRSSLHVSRRVLSVLSKWRERIRQRRLLASLDDRALGDIGLSRYDVERETSKPFWRG